jgi:hypothetical protein
MMKKISLSLAVLTCVAASASYAGTTGRSVSLTQEPLVLRVSNDEFRIAFGLNGQGCIAGCNGIVRYRVEWKAADGQTRSETRHVAYVVSPQAPRTIAVDRQYFHRGESRDTTEIVKVQVDGITCVEGTGRAAGELAKL